MLTLYAPEAQTLWDPLLPIGVGELPADLCEIDARLSDPALVLPIAAHWQREAQVRGYSTAGVGRPTIPMQTYVRLMVLKQRSRWGYETLGAGGVRLDPPASFLPDSVGRAASRRVDDPQADATTRRPDSERVVPGGDRGRGLGAALSPACGEDRLDSGRSRRALPDRRGAGGRRGWAAGARGRQAEGAPRARQDAVAGCGSRPLARRGPAAAGHRPDAQVSLGRAQAARPGADRRGGQALGELDPRGAGACERAARQGPRARRTGKLAAAECLEELADRCGKVAVQVRKRVKGEPIADRIISLHDTDAPPIRRASAASRPSSATSPRSPR